MYRTEKSVEMRKMTKRLKLVIERYTFPSLLPVQAKEIKVNKAKEGAETENIKRCFLVLFLSSPS